MLEDNLDEIVTSDDP